MERRWRPALEIPALFAAAFFCAWISNHIAAPVRHLSWLPGRTIPIVAPAVPAPASAALPPLKAEAPLAKPHREAAAGRLPSPASTDWDPAALLARFPPLQGRPYANISGDEARWLQLHGALILDARRSDVYAAGHLPGAQSLPVWEDGLPEKLAHLGVEKADPILPVVVYCAGGDCEDSHLLGQKLWLAGFRNVRVYTDGFPGWEARGWPTHQGEAP